MRLLTRVLVVLLLATFFVPFGSAFAQTPTPPAEQPFQPLVPELGVPIPGLEFTPATREGTDIVVPYIGQYINAGYRYLVSVILVVAIIMVVWGGFRYLLGSADVGNITRAKEIIRDAIAGMLLVIGAFLILQTVNPATVDIRSLSLSAVQRHEIELSLLANTEDNSDTTASWTSGGGQSASAGVPAPTGGASTRRRFTECPVTLTQPENRRPYEQNPRSQEFMRLMGSVITGGTRSERMISFLDAAQQCRVYLGCCLCAAQLASGFAVGRPGESVSGGRFTNKISEELFLTLRENRCLRGTTCSLRAQRALVFERIRRATPGWPDSWLPQLQAGDSIIIFNANPIDRNGNHTQVFIGWTRPGVARVLQGSPGQPVRFGNVCLASTCEDPYPLIRVRSPN